MSRTYLTAPLTYYVAPTGDDSWAGDAQNPFKHIQYAVNKIANEVDCAGHQATVQLCGGSAQGGVYFYESVELPNYVGGAVRTTHTNPTVRGDPAHPEYHIVYSASTGGFLSITNPLPWTLDGITIYNDGSAACIEADNTGLLYYRNLLFGPAKQHVFSIINSAVVMCGNCAMNAGAESHLSVEEGGLIVFQPGWNVTLGLGLSFTYFTRAANGGVIEVQSNNTWTGTSTSVPAYADWGGIIQTNGAGLPCTGQKIEAHDGHWYN